ncbi:PAS domain-containing protein [Pontibacter sp. SGAir0037]|uniref:PAS domain-containing protein n=1 Tax=Pontibacter sp. SGAir0037 TaxID=2571030 RepID=UPI0010CCB186|nr:PAS domain-containing protein [Pontibacter sp. SGAir0037]QCR23573.1 hypothetical protein C1N53_15290 [Pontibacter sp. SGAir0037]
MSEENRLKELNAYQILDTLPEQELDELAEIASAICDTPISLMSFIDDRRQWFKAKKGINIAETPRQDAFCQHALHNPKEVLVVVDPLNDDRFKNNPLVLGSPYIRFYAGAPLETPTGNVLGTLCVIDDKPREISENQKKALKLLAKKAIDYLEFRKILLEQGDRIELSAARLKKLTDLAPGAIYQFEMTANGKMSFTFLSKGIAEIHPDLDPEELKQKPELGFGAIHPEDLPVVQQSIQESFIHLTSWDMEYRVVSKNGTISWHWANANPEKQEDGTVVWYGTFQDITDRKEYIKALEQILHDISHVMRRPVATMLGLTSAIEKEVLNEKTLLEYLKHIKTVSKEMDDYIRALNDVYHSIKLNIADRYKVKIH